MTKKIDTLADLTPDGENFNKHTEFGQKLLEDSLRKFGAGRSILVDKDGNIIAGNSTTETAAAIGMEDVIVVPTDGKKLVVVQRTDLSLDSREGRELALADNMTALKGIDLDLAKVQEALGDDLAKAWGMDIPEVQKQAQEDDFDPDKPVETVCKKGDIWKLGNHRLMCGDSTDAGSVALLMDGERADLVFTDPPYGMFLDVDYDGMFANDDTRAFDTGKRFDKVKGDNDDFKPELITTIFDNFGDCPEVFIWGADYFSELIPNRKDGSWVVWDKRCSEEMDKVAGNTFELCWSKAKHKRLIARIEWSGFHGMNGADSGKRVHPTQKPIALIDFFIKHWGEKANIVLDLFGGSGTTLIAAEQLNRKCFMMELDPHYCDVIIARWEKLTGNKAERISNGN